MVRAEDRFDIPKYLIGDVENRKFIHQYILGRPSFQMGLGWDNSDPIHLDYSTKKIIILICG